MYLFYALRKKRCRVVGRRRPALSSHFGYCRKLSVACKHASLSVLFTCPNPLRSVPRATSRGSHRCRRARPPSRRGPGQSAFQPRDGETKRIIIIVSPRIISSGGANRSTQATRQQETFSAQETHVTTNNGRRNARRSKLTADPNSLMHNDDTTMMQLLEKVRHHLLFRNRFKQHMKRCGCCNKHLTENKKKRTHVI